LQLWPPSRCVIRSHWMNASVQACSCEGPTATYLQHAVKHVRSQLKALYMCCGCCCRCARKAHAAWGSHPSCHSCHCALRPGAHRARSADAHRPARGLPTPALTSCDSSAQMCIPQSAARSTGPDISLQQARACLRPTTLAGVSMPAEGCFLVAAAAATSAPTPSTEQSPRPPFPQQGC